MLSRNKKQSAKIPFPEIKDQKNLKGKGMYILGFDCYGHDAAAALLKDGKLVAAVEEERFVRKKHTPEYPINAMRWCCEQAGIKPAELDHIVYYWNPYIGLGERAKHIIKYFPKSLRLLNSRTEKFLPMVVVKRTTRDKLNLSSSTKVHFAEHHALHAASAFFVSQFEKAAILSIDAAGEWASTWLGYGEENKLHCLKQIDFPHSLGLVYGGITEYLGFKFANGEGKVMGLAPYGDPDRFIDIFREIVRCKDDGEFEVDLNFFEYHYKGRPFWISKKFLNAFGPARIPESDILPHHKDVAAALQKRTEEVCFHMAEWLYKKTQLPSVCLAGGVCLNSVMNGKLLQRGPFKDVWIQPMANDAGTSIGACYWLWNEVMKNPRSYVMEHAYLGPQYDEEDVKKSFDSMDVKGVKLENPSQRAAEYVARGKIIGWFSGRMECGPRALGNRSILADPRNPGMKDILNSRVKFRESFRPFAPSVLEEKSQEYFDDSYPSPFMILVFNVLNSMKEKIPAVTHVDGTVRVQTVSQKLNPGFYELIHHFGQLTGIYCVLNTSFNIRGQPIVNTPEEAIECFLKTGMDALFIEGYLLEKNEQS
jgi:carbamoyltransferase